MSATVYFSSGTVVNRDAVVITAGFLVAPDAATSRIYLKFDDFWAAHDVPTDLIVSTTFSAPMGRLFALGRNGLVKYVGNKNQTFTRENICGHFQQTQLRSAKTRGSMTCIRAVGATIYSCGWGGQIYQLVRDEWLDFTHGIPAGNDHNFLDFDGTADDDLYVVGMGGAIYHNDGNGWQRLDFPTNAHLYSVRCTSRDEAYVAGSNGAFFRGVKDEWTFVGDVGLKGNFWCLDKFGQDMYATYANTGLLRLKDDRLSAVDMELHRKPTTHKIHANNGVLWSFGAYDLAVYDGSTWRAVICPDND